MSRKKSSGSQVLGILVVIAIAIIVAIPKEVWIFLSLLGVLAGGFYLLVKALGTSRKPTDSFVESTVPMPIEKEKLVRSNSLPKAREIREARGWEEPYFSVRQAPASTPREYRIPAPKEPIRPRWLRAGEATIVSGRKIPGGLVYVGSQSESISGDCDPCLINLSKKVGRSGDFRVRLLDYWPNYSHITPEARAAYLEWLADGRRNPEADVGYVFLFFYGLERRAIVDSSNDPDAQADLPAIAMELEELLAVYGPGSGSFRRYAEGLLTMVRHSRIPEKTYLLPLPESERTYETPLSIKIALGQAAMDGCPVPTHLALAWAEHAPEISWRTPAKRCRSEFVELFSIEYAEKFGEGMRIPANKTKLRHVYHPASAAIGRLGGIEGTFGGIPDVTVLTKPINDLRNLVETVTVQLEPYSRLLGRSTATKDSLEALLCLPYSLWREQSKAALADLSEKASRNFQVMTVAELLSKFGASAMLTKDRFISLCQIMSSMEIAIEPDFPGGARNPKLEDHVVLFKPAHDGKDVETAPYKLAKLTLDLASAVAIADGTFSSEEFDHLIGQVENWNHLSLAHRKRLHAYIHLLQKAPLSLSAIKKRLEPLDEKSRTAIAGFMSTVARADGVVSVSEVKLLEKIYTAIGVDSKQVFSDVHSASTTIPSSRSPSTETSGFSLDPSRIAELHEDTEKVSALLSKIFSEDQEPELREEEHLQEPAEAEAEPVSGNFLSLDDAHAAFARLLLTRSEWSRSDLNDPVSDLDLMLDGALEQINEASWDTYDLAFTEGEDPITINPELLEKVAA